MCPHLISKNKSKKYFETKNENLNFNFLVFDQNQEFRL